MGGQAPSPPLYYCSTIGRFGRFYPAYLTPCRFLLRYTNQMLAHDVREPSTSGADPMS